MKNFWFLTFTVCFALVGGDRSSLLCARAVPRCGRSCPTEGHCAGERPLPFGARPWCDVPAAASNAKPAPLVTRRTRAGTRCLWREGAPHELAVRARHITLVVVGSCPVKGHCTGERPPSFGPRPWCDVPAAASNAKPAPRVSRSAGVLCSLSLGRRRSTRAFSVRAPCRAGCGRTIRRERAPHW